jgi:hypothetical protein
VPTVKTITLSNVKRRNISWLWEQYIPLERDLFRNLRYSIISLLSIDDFFLLRKAAAQ